MIRRTSTWLVLAASAAATAAACSSGGSSADPTTVQTSPTTATVADPNPPATTDADPLHVAIVWHMHQPRYPIVDGAVSRPWVRAHATKDYLDMALQAADSGVPVTINLTPSLLLQLEELTGGTKDAYRVHTEIPAEDLTAAQRDFVVERFFDTNPLIVDRFARYRELRDMDPAAMTTDDLRDLQVLWNLAWFDPRFLAEAPLAELVERGSGYDEADKAVVLGEVDRVVGEVIPTYARLWREGRIELTTTPLAHPILPLVADTDLFRESDPQGIGPTERGREYLDAGEHVERGLDVAERLLGQRPTGMWPGEGAVAQDVVKLFSDAGVEWIATGEDVLARSLGTGGFERDEAGTVTRPDELYRPWTVRHREEPPVGIVFRDTTLSDLVGFEYSGRPADEAADDLVTRLQHIRTALAGSPGPHLVTILLDGENAWEHYPNDGIDFLDAMYERLAGSDGIVPTTPSAFTREFGAEAPALDRLAAGSWIGGNLATWIGEPEEAAAWSLLRTTRLALRSAEQQGTASAEQIAAATEPMLWAQGSDWFWWYGNDQDSGNDDYFDAAYRELLGQVYDALDQPRPPWVPVPLVVTPPVVAGADGTLSGDAGTFVVGFDATSLTLDLRDVSPAAEVVEVYVGSPRGGAPARGTTLDGRVLGFGATQLVRLDRRAGTTCLIDRLPPVGVPDPTRPCEPVGESTNVVIPVADLGGPQQGDRLFLRAVTPDAMIPTHAPGAVVTPDVGGVEPVLALTDPIGDDHGPGSTTYPTDAVFTPGTFDLVGFEWGLAGDEAVFTFDLAGPVRNPWGSPNGLALQTFDVYLDADPGSDTGEHDLVAGRGALLGEPDGWDAAVVVEGWTSKVVRSTPTGRVEERPTMSIAALEEEGRVIVRVPIAALGLTTDPATWAVGVTLSSQDGFPSAGVDRIRDVEGLAQQWRLGGGASTRIVDLLHPDAGAQERLLSDPQPAIVLFGAV